MSGENRIPKTIHYCWLGNNKMGLLGQRCIESWHKYLGDWKFVLWNEDALNTGDLRTAKLLADNKRYAFASDYLRSYAIYKQGGIYLDTDVEVIRSLEPLLDNGQFLGYEAPGQPTSGVCGGVAGAAFFKAYMDIMDEHYGRTDKLIISPEICAKAMQRGPFPDMFIYPQHVFYPYNPYDNTRSLDRLMFDDIKPDTLAIHHWAKSWKFSLSERIVRRLARDWKKLTGRFIGG